MGVKLGTLDISSFKVGSADCKVYLGETLLYSGDTPTPPTPSYKFTATYSDGTSYSEECDSDTTLTTATTKPSGYQSSLMTSAVVGDCVTSIGQNAFMSFSSLSSVTIPNSVTTLGVQSFAACGIVSVEIPNSVTSIGDTCFGYSTSLTSVTIGSGVTAIAKYAFASCTSLSSITINTTTPPVLASGDTYYNSTVFNDTNNCPIYVPAEAVTTYKNSWSAFGNRIQAIQ